MPSGEFQELGANGQTAAVLVSGPVRLSLTGDFGSGTAQVQAKNPNGVWLNVDNGSFTAVTDSIFDFPPGLGVQLRVDLTGSTGPSLNVWFQASGF